MPPNYGRVYTEQFAKMYVDLAHSNEVALVPFFLTGVADVPEAEQYFLNDRIHPNELAQPIILQNILPKVRELLLP